MSDFFDGETVEPTVDTTSNIEFQLNRFSDDEYFTVISFPALAREEVRSINPIEIYVYYI